MLDQLETTYPGFAERLFDEKGELRRFVNVFVADEDIRFLSGVDTAVDDGPDREHRPRGRRRSLTTHLTSWVKLPLPNSAGHWQGAFMSTGEIYLLGAIAGLTIFLGLPVGRIRGMSKGVAAFINAIAAGVLVFLLVETCREPRAGRASRSSTSPSRAVARGAGSRHAARCFSCASASGCSGSSTTSGG